MIDFGGKLRAARETRGIPLRQVAARTKISVAALEALERNDISKLPGGIFSRAFVRAYAVEVGLDPDEVTADYLARVAAEPPAPAGPAVRISEADLAFERSQRRAAAAFVLAIIVMLVVGAAVLFYVLRGRPATMDLTRPAQSGARIPGADPAAPPVASPPAAQPAAAQPVAAQPAPAETAAAAPMRLELHPTGACWVSVVVDGKAALSRTMKAGERETLTVADHAVISVDDAGAFAFSVDGKAGRSLGRAGQSVTMRLTAETRSDYVR